jgi:hypothetical protein
LRQLPTFVSVAVLVWAVAVTLRVPVHELSWTVPAYVSAQCLFGLIGLWGLQRESLTSPTYTAFFLVGFFAVLLAAMVCAGRFVAAFPIGLAVFVLVGCVAFACACGAVTYWRLLFLYRGAIPYSSIGIVWQGAILIGCGAISLLSYLAEDRPALRVSALALGLFWFALGAFFLLYSIGIVRVFSSYFRLNQFVPTFLAIIAFAWLAFSLSGLQAETARESVPQNMEVISQ